jgi:capsular exopolysaccharide synthesis family protein
MIQLNSELSATREKIAAETNLVTQAIKNEYRMAQAQEENLKSALNATKADTQDLGDRVIQYRVLLRDVETNRALYENVLKSLKTTITTENIPATNIRIVYPATVPSTPISPRKARNLLIATVLGFCSSIVVAFGLENLDTTLKTPEEVERWLQIPNLAMIPHLEFSSENPSPESAELFVHHGREPLAAESCRALRTSILFSTPGNAPRTLLITSTIQGEGKTLVAANLATVMAKAEPGGVLLVDSDLRRPCIWKMFSGPKEPGLSNFLVGEIEELPVVETMVPNLFVLPAGIIPPDPSELLGSERMVEMLARAKERFARVILDSPPLIAVTDGAILSTHVDGVLMLIKAEATPRKLAIDAVDRLHELKAPLLGAVFNNMLIQRHGYYYHYYYHRYYSRYYTGGKTSHQISSKKNPRVRREGGSWVTNYLNKFKKKIS